ncbi:MAG: hypothetical protein AB7F89_05850 [Pirellulaceae bacterium]
MRGTRVRWIVVGMCGLVGGGWLGVWQDSWAQQQALGQPPSLGSQPTTPAVKPLVLSDGLIALSSDTADGKQQVVVIDTKTRGMSVYHVDHATGGISLRSARNISADLLMDEFNTNQPLPDEIRSMLSSPRAAKKDTR